MKNRALETQSKSALGNIEYHLNELIREIEELENINDTHIVSISILNAELYTANEKIKELEQQISDNEEVGF